VKVVMMRVETAVDVLPQTRHHKGARIIDI